MAIHILMDAETLAASRFALSPAVEVLGTVMGRHRHPRPHARRWYQRAAEHLPSRTLALLPPSFPPTIRTARTS